MKKATHAGTWELQYNSLAVKHIVNYFGQHSRYSLSTTNSGDKDRCVKSNFLALTGNDTSFPRSAVLAINLANIVTLSPSPATSVIFHSSSGNSQPLTSIFSSLLNQPVMETSLNPAASMATPKFACTSSTVSIGWLLSTLVNNKL